MLISEIRKEEIPNLVFNPGDVLNTNDKKKERQDKLEQALHIGNLDKQKAKIVFEDLSGMHFVYTTIWFVSDMHVQLKSGVLLPIASILEVIL